MTLVCLLCSFLDRGDSFEQLEDQLDLLSKGNIEFPTSSPVDLGLSFNETMQGFYTLGTNCVLRKNVK